MTITPRGPLGPAPTPTDIAIPSVPDQGGEQSQGIAPGGGSLILPGFPVAGELVVVDATETDPRDADYPPPAPGSRWIVRSVGPRAPGGEAVTVSRAHRPPFEEVVQGVSLGPDPFIKQIFSGPGQRFSPVSGTEQAAFFDAPPTREQIAASRGLMAGGEAGAGTPAAGAPAGAGLIVIVLIVVVALSLWRR